MKIEKVNIGLLIEQKMNELNINKSEMARRSGIANQNINRVLERPSIDTDKLVSISEALDFNFFDCYRSINENNEATADNDGVAVSGNNNQVNGHGAHDNINGDASTAIWSERVKSLEALLKEKERLIKVYEQMMEKR